MNLSCSELVLKSSCKAYEVYGCRWGESCYQTLDKETGKLIRGQVSAIREVKHEPVRKDLPVLQSHLAF